MVWQHQRKRWLHWSMTLGVAVRFSSGDSNAPSHSVGLAGQLAAPLLHMQLAESLQKAMKPFATVGDAIFCVGTE